MTPLPDPDEHAPDERPTTPRRLALEIALLFIASLVLTRLLSDLANISSLVSEYLFTLVAAVFLLLPWLALNRRRASFTQHAMTWDGWPRATLAALALTALTFAPFAAGYHLWRTRVLEHTFQPDLDNYSQLPLTLEGRPHQLATPGRPEILIWRESNDLTIQWSTPARDASLQIDLDAPGATLLLPRGKQHARDPEIRAQGRATDHLTLRSSTQAPTTRFVTLRLHNADDLTLRFTLDGKPAPPQALKLGPQRLPPDQIGAWDPARGALTLSRSASWIPLIVLAQLLLVAFPEEFFYRGYLQTSLQRLLPWRLDLKIVHTSAAILLTSALFAIGHVVIDPRPQRLAVFFPSLLFGFLRDRTHTLVACIVYHAACNLMVEALAPHYLLP